MSDVNLATRLLLEQGWTKEKTPPGMKPWKDWYGGWTFDREAVQGMLFETPCGLLVEGHTFLNGYMAYGGIDWRVENNCPTITCPYFGRKPCDLLAEPLRGAAMLVRGSEIIQPCATRQVDKEWDYDNSLKKVIDDNQRLENELWEKYSAQRKGRTCRVQSYFNRTTQEWHTVYDWRRCTELKCSHCMILDQDMSPKRANVYYDLKRIAVQEGEGLFPDREIVSITKGLKLLEHPVSETLCEIIARRKDTAEDIVFKKRLSRNVLEKIRFEVQNIRVERRESRDLLQDLADIKAGIAVVHASDAQKAAKAEKSVRREKALARRVARSEKLVLEKGFDELDSIEQRRAEKLLGSDRILELDLARQNPPEPEVQTNLFDICEKQACGM